MSFLGLLTGSRYWVFRI